LLISQVQLHRPSQQLHVIPTVNEDNFEAFINAMVDDDKFDDVPSYISSITRSNLSVQEAYKLWPDNVDAVIEN
jgi:hypothetical protein